MPPEMGAFSLDQSVSIVLSRETPNYRSIAQQHYNLTNEQMEGMHVHHNPPRSQGGRNVPEHLYVYSPSMHRFGAHDGLEWVEWASEGGRKAVKVNRETSTGVYGLTPEQRSSAGKVGGSASRNKGVGIHAPGVKTFETCSNGGVKGGAKTRDSGQLLKASKLGGAVQGPRNKGMAWYHRYGEDGNIIRKRSKTPLSDPWVPGKGKTK